MIKLFDALRKRRSMQSVALLAHDLADGCLGEVWTRIGLQVHNMDAVEARGYVRVRSATVIRRQLRTMNAVKNLPSSAQTKLSALAIERVVQHVIADLLEQRSASLRAVAA
ncbi:MAG: hypothetical protein N2C12_06415 [Planctomycetales bacterium]